MSPFHCKGWFTSPFAELSIVLKLLYWILWALFYYHRHSLKSDIECFIIIIYWQYTSYPVLLYNKFRPIMEFIGHLQTEQFSYIYSSSFKRHLYNFTIIWCLVNSSMKWNWSEVAYLHLYLLPNCIVQRYKVNFG